MSSFLGERVRLLKIKVWAGSIHERCAILKTKVRAGAIRERCAILKINVRAGSIHERFAINQSAKPAHSPPPTNPTPARRSYRERGLLCRNERGHDAGSAASSTCPVPCPKYSCRSYAGRVLLGQGIFELVIGTRPYGDYI